MKFFYFSVLFLFIGLHVHGQQYLGVAGSNYLELQTVYSNPANLGDSRHRFQFNLFSFNTYFANDYVALKSAKGLADYIKNPDGKDFKDLLSYSDDAKRKRGDFLAEVRGPSFMVALSPRHSIALSSRIRNMVQLDKANAELLSLAVNGFADADASLYSGLVNNEDFVGKAHAFSETNLSYGRVLFDGRAHFLKGGVTGKYLSGLAMAEARNRDITIDFDFDVNTREGSLVTRRADLDVAYTDNFDDYTFGISRFFGKDRTGKGWGVDLGVVYEYRPNPGKYFYDMDGEIHRDNSQNKYRLKVSAAITDFGRIIYNNGDITRKYTFNSQSNVPWSPNDIDNFDIDQFETIMAGKYGSSFSRTSKVSQHLPAALNIQTDYRLTRNLYVGASFLQHLAGKGTPSLYNTLAAVTPRLETRHFEVSAPVSYVSKYDAVNIGAAVRAGFFFLGSDNLTLLKKENIKSTNFYFGLMFNLNKKRLKDRDGDRISNKLDECMRISGSADNKGCPFPDGDGDGVFDKDDQCPAIAGIVSLGGCPDTDKDGVPDDSDACPTLAGTGENQGCPDTDSDGITDRLDACPQEAGPAGSEGCPDRDGDGIPDREDRCPDVAGVKHEQGCPPGKHGKVVPVKVINQAVGSLQFSTGRAAILPASYNSLNILAAVLKETNGKLTLTGYTDNTGSEELNLQLSRSRVEAVRTYLVSKGVNPVKIIAIGMGEAHPIATNATPEGRKMNRRVEFQVD